MKFLLPVQLLIENSLVVFRKHRHKLMYYECKTSFSIHFPTKKSIFLLEIFALSYHTVKHRYEQKRPVSLKALGTVYRFCFRTQVSLLRLANSRVQLTKVSNVPSLYIRTPMKRPTRSICLGHRTSNCDIT